MRSVYSHWQVTDQRQAATFTISGLGTGSGAVLSVEVEGVAATLATTLAETAIDAAGKLKTAIDAALAAAGVSDVTVTDNGDGSVQVSRDDNLPIFVEALTGDATQTIVASSWWHSLRQLAGVTAQGAGGETSRADSAGALGAHSSRDGSGYALVTFAARLHNGTAGAKAARWRAEVYSPVLGWFVHPEIGTRVINNAGNGWVDDVVQVFAEGWTRARVVLVDDDGSSPADLTGTGVQFDARVQVG